MSDFKAEMHQIVCRLGLRPRPRWKSFFTALPQTPSWILGGILLREGGEGTPCSPITPIHYILQPHYRVNYENYNFHHSACIEIKWKFDISDCYSLLTVQNPVKTVYFKTCAECPPPSHKLEVF